MKAPNVKITCSCSAILAGAAIILMGIGNVARANGNPAAARQCINTCNEQWSQCEQNCNGDFDCSVHCDTAKHNCINYCQRL